MFESWMGPEAFRKGVQTYLRRHAYGNATATDFLDALGTDNRKQVREAFSTFLDQAGVPLVSVALDCRQSAATLHLEQARFLPLGSKGTATQVWSIPVCVRYDDGGSGRTDEPNCKPGLPTARAGVPFWARDRRRGVSPALLNYLGFQRLVAPETRDHYNRGRTAQ